MFGKSFIILTLVVVATTAHNQNGWGSGDNYGQEFGHGHNNGWEQYGHHGYNNQGGLSRKEMKEEYNKRIVLALYQELFGDKDLSAIDRYISPTTYIQHNPTVGDGPAAFKAAMQDIVGQPKEIIDVQHAGADGDFVYLHIKNPSIEVGKIYSVMDIFRLQNGKIVEHWDVQQVVPDVAANSHPMF